MGFRIQRAVCSIDMFVKCPDEGANKSSIKCSLLNSLATHLARSCRSTLWPRFRHRARVRLGPLRASPPMFPAVTWVFILIFCLVSS